jgi:hypothetical protein
MYPQLQSYPSLLQSYPGLDPSQYQIPSPFPQVVAPPINSIPQIYALSVQPPLAGLPSLQSGAIVPAPTNILQVFLKIWNNVSNI